MPITLRLSSTNVDLRNNPDLTKAQIVELQKALLDGELAEELAHRREELRPIFRLAALPLAHLAPRQAEYRIEPQMNRLTRAGPTVLSSAFVLVFEWFQKLFGSMRLQPARPVRHGASRYGRRAAGRGSRIRP